jgi:hypothetical protein
MRRATFLSTVAITALLAALVGTAAAQDLNTFNEKLIHDFADANSPDTVAPGTKFTTANWQQYRKFMPISLQAFMSGNYFWKMGTGPGYYSQNGWASWRRVRVGGIRV